MPYHRKKEGWSSRVRAVGVLILVATILAGTGCVSKKKAQSAVRRQAEVIAMQQAWIARNQGPAPVTVLGDVRNHQIAWSDDLTLARALLEAQWLNRNDPRRIIVLRGADRFSVDPDELTDGVDYALEPGDRLEISR